ncbi:integrase, catalytic region, zinc finger, CCHC-type containing protein [Tanacetum coccineum]
MGNVTISWVYYVEGLGHNLFSMGQFCDSDLEVAFRKHTCFICDLDGVDLLKGSQGSNLYTLSMDNLLLSSPICLLSKASKSKSWLWNQRLSHLNFDYINSLAKHGLVRDLGKLKPKADIGIFVGYAEVKCNSTTLYKGVVKDLFPFALSGAFWASTTGPGLGLTLGLSPETRTILDY